jgi:hypothetical protein
MGDAAEDVYASFKLSDDNAKKYDTAMRRFDVHFIVTKNVIFKRAQFNQRKQEPRESTEAFVTALHKLADSCNFGALRKELIRDRIVVGIHNAKISERLQLDRELKLAIAVTVIRQAEQVHQQRLLRAPTNTQASCDVNAIKTYRQHSQPKTISVESHIDNTSRQNPRKDRLKWCGRQNHDRQQCPAREAICRNCKKTGHFEKVCRSEKKSVRAISTMNTLFLDTVSNDKQVNTWQVDVSVNKLVKFRLDTGADAACSATGRDVQPSVPGPTFVGGQAAVRSKSCTAGCRWSVQCAAAVAGPSHNTDRLRRTGHSPTATRACNRRSRHGQMSRRRQQQPRPAAAVR